MSGYDARVLACKLIETCRPYQADPSAIVSALSVVLGSVIGKAAKNSEVVDIAIETIYLAIAADDEDDRAGGLQ